MMEQQSQSKCEVCGKANATTKANIEGSVMQVCDTCKKSGIEIEPERTYNYSKAAAKAKSSETELYVVPDYAQKIKHARLQLDMTQGELADKINERHTIISNIESGKREPTIKCAKKLERTLHIELLEELNSEAIINTSDKKEFTLGDMIAIKDKRKKRE